MEKVLLITTTMFAIALAFSAFFSAQNNESVSRKWAKVHVRTDDRERRQIEQPRENDFDSSPSLDWLIFGTAILLFFAVLSLVR